MCYFLQSKPSIAEARIPHEMLSVQDRGAPSMHRHSDGPRAVHVQAYLPRRGCASVPGADRHPPPLGAPPD